MHLFIGEWYKKKEAGMDGTLDTDEWQQAGETSSTRAMENGGAG